MQTLASLSLKWDGSEVMIETINTIVQPCVNDRDATNVDAPVALKARGTFADNGHLYYYIF